MLVSSLRERRVVMHLTVFGKGSKTRFVPVHPAALSAIKKYLDLAGHREDKYGALFRPARNPRGTHHRGRDLQVGQAVRGPGRDRGGRAVHALAEGDGGD